MSALDMLGYGFILIILFLLFIGIVKILSGAFEALRKDDD